MRYVLRPMRVEDIEPVIDIERRSFSLSWPASAYRREIRDNRLASYIVVELAGQPESVPAARTESVYAGGVMRLLRSVFGSGNARKRSSNSSIVGYAGLWLMVDEAHVTTIAVRPEYRGRGLGELLMVGLIDKAMDMGARWVTLEVLISNTVAQNLYKKYTFHVEGVRKGYYSDNHEDALIMWSEDIRTEEFRGKFRQLKEGAARRIRSQEDP